MVASKNEFGKFYLLFNFLEEFVYKKYHILLKYFVEYTSEAIWF